MKLNMADFVFYYYFTLKFLDCLTVVFCSIVLLFQE